MQENAPIPPLRSINGYEILELIAAGGMSRVYRANDREGRTVAVKVIQFDEMAADYERRLRREPEIQRGVGHDNIVRLIDWFRVGGEFFLVMEYIDGRSLWRMIREDGPLPFERAREYLRQILPAVSHLHDLGIIHRDIKPANILVTRDDVVKLADFGIAKYTWQQGQTRTQLGIGTPEYMSPEQARGVAIDQRSDIYSLGITLYEMLTGRPPFTSEGETPAGYSHVIQAILTTPVPDPRSVRPELPSGVAALIARATAKDPRDRFTSCEQMLRALVAIDAVERSSGTVVLGEGDGEREGDGRDGRDGGDREDARGLTDGDWRENVLRDAGLIEARRGIARRPAIIALVLLLVAGAAFAASQLIGGREESPVTVAASRPAPETPAQIAARAASSYRQHSLAHDVAGLAALYASDSVAYLNEGVLGRDSILAELREDYRRLARTDSFSVSVDTARALGDTAVSIAWQTSYGRVRTDSSRFSGRTRDELTLEREGAAWRIVEHERRLLAGVAPDGPYPRVTSTGGSSVSRPARRPSTGRASSSPSRQPVISVRIDRGVKVDIGKPGKGGKGKGSKAKKRRD